MASRKDNRKDEPATAKAEEPLSISQQQKEEEIREAIVDAFDEAKDNTQKAVKEARKEIPRYTEAVNNYQEQTLEAAREIAENYIESQKEIINSFQQSTWVSQIGNAAYQTFWSNWMLSPKKMTETYASMVSHYVDNTFTAARLVNNMIFANMEAFKTSMQQTKDNAKEFSRIAVNNAKMFEQAAGEYIKSSNQLRDSVERESQKK
ncbi:MAG TPA: hypothetical protein VIP70_12255 [Nitrososphaeraceae archaeon]